MQPDWPGKGDRVVHPWATWMKSELIVQKEPHWRQTLTTMACVGLLLRMCLTTE